MSWSRDNCARFAALRAAEDRSQAARLAAERVAVAAILNSEWHVGMMGGQNAANIYAYNGVNEYADDGVCAVFGLPLHVPLDKVKEHPGYAVAERICKLHNDALALERAHAADAAALAKRRETADNDNAEECGDQTDTQDRCHCRFCHCSVRCDTGVCDMCSSGAHQG